jgi:hypothetical protein
VDRRGHCDGWLGVAHKPLAKVANLSVRKTLAASVLADPTRFKKV